MALADRHYMRDEFNPPRMTSRLIIALIAAFVFQSILLFYRDYDAIQHLGLTVDGLLHGRVWQLFTFQFLHAAPWPWHVLFNCLGLWFFGRPVEEMLGSRKFLKLYFLSGLAGGALQAFLTLALPRHMDIPVVGASAGVCGLIAIFCSLFPMQELTAWIYFFPVRIRARYLLYFLGGISIFGSIIPFDGIAHAAHLGGILTGVVFVRYGRAIADWSERFWPRPKEPGLKLRSQRRVKRKKGGASALWESSTETFISREVDPILDKISAHGFESLTEQERKVLDGARKKMSG
jgi:membrane associated rhomboid family serine protease